MANSSVDGYPAEHHQFVRRMRRSVLRSLSISGGAAIFLCCGYIHDWPTPLFQLAPAALLIYSMVLLSTPGSIGEMRVVRVLPYFKKGDPQVQGDTFLAGKAFARNWNYLETMARESGLEPLANYGFQDDLLGDHVDWQEPGPGLSTVSGLLDLLRRDPSKLRESAAVIDDLARVEFTLQDACRLQVPFCLLLRHGDTASGHEMDMRQGYFCYGEAD